MIGPWGRQQVVVGRGRWVVHSSKGFICHQNATRTRRKRSRNPRGGNVKLGLLSDNYLERCLSGTCFHVYMCLHRVYMFYSMCTYVLHHVCICFTSRLHMFYTVCKCFTPYLHVLNHLLTCFIHTLVVMSWFFSSWEI